MQIAELRTNKDPGPAKLQTKLFSLDSNIGTILCIGAHCDDIEIGCSGTLQRLALEHPSARIIWAIFAGEHIRESESRAAAAALFPRDQKLELRFHNFRGSYFPSQYEEIKTAFEELKKFEPQLVFTHYLKDRHQDHSLLAELTWNTFRSHQVLEYEIPKYEGDLGHPNCYFPLSEQIVNKKISVLMEHFPSQRSRSWFTPDTFRALARIRGLECHAPERFAEAFHVRKFCL